jgi:hypothetical protein
VRESSALREQPNVLWMLPAAIMEGLLGRYSDDGLLARYSKCVAISDWRSVMQRASPCTWRFDICNDNQSL